MAILKLVITDKESDCSADGTRTRRIKWRVTSNSFAENENTVMLACASFGQTHPDDNRCYCHRLSSKLDPTRIKGVFRWSVTAEFTTRPRQRCNDLTSHPLDQPAEVEWLFEKTQEIVLKARRIDDQGQPSVEEFPVQNSAGQKFRDPLLKDATVLGARITDYRTTWNPLTALDHVDHLNSQQFRLRGIWFPPRTAMVKLWTAQEQYVGTCERFYKHTIELEFRKQPEGKNYSGFDAAVIDQGTGELLPPDGNGVRKFRLIADKDGPKISDDVALDGNGMQLLPLPLDDNNPPVELVWRRHPERSFAALDLPRD